MARILFNSDTDQFNGSLKGQTFYSGDKVSTIRNIAQVRCRRSAKQLDESRNFIIASRSWRQLSSDDRQTWIDFVALYPQSLLSNPSHILTPFELFVIRNVLHLRNYDPAEPIFSSTILDPIDSNNFTAQIYYSAGFLYFFPIFDRFDFELGYDLYMSMPQITESGLLQKERKYISNFITFSNELYISENYLNVWGRLPLAGEYIFISLLEFGRSSGHFFEFSPTSVIVESF